MFKSNEQYPIHAFYNVCKFGIPDIKLCRKIFKKLLAEKFTCFLKEHKPKYPKVWLMLRIGTKKKIRYAIVNMMENNIKKKREEKAANE